MHPKKSDTKLMPVTTSRTSLNSASVTICALFQNDKNAENENENETEGIEYSRVDYVRVQIFKILKHPRSSIFSALYYVLTLVLALLSVTLMIVGTCPDFQFQPEPSKCHYCNQNINIHFLDLFIDVYNATGSDAACVCPPQEIHIFKEIQTICQVYFTIDLTLRILCYVPYKSYGSTFLRRVKEWSKILMSPSTIIDFLAILPFLASFNTKFFHMFRLFRLFSIFRLARFSRTSRTLSVVMWKSLTNLMMLVIVLLIGSCLFSSLIYWFEIGKWKYTDLTNPPSFQYVRKTTDGIEDEISPFKSIPGSFYWFFVTVTTVGYGDFYPTSSLGKFVAVITVLLGLLVVAFPVSVFAELWSDELEKRRTSVMPNRPIDTKEENPDNISSSLPNSSNENKSNTLFSIEEENSNFIEIKKLDSLSNQEREKNDDIPQDSVKTGKSSSLVLDQCKYDALLHNWNLINESKNEINCRLVTIDKAQEEINQILMQVDINSNQ